ncbi:hypothetical protein [Streptomyces neyagawaensis]|uniref:hypothetical protein n=1 Tax=Streptomyces neyagawaensis TaxID=42238 RepID=UPI0006E41892|nr:hypothetical protein [Streptomyces neyagawaensis]MCL6739438.1 hypothetical protein [Streptomyces neyagawaensis]MDE1688348.1 hypothetical protein [Streptomyces neyagawaensis]MDG5808512.1 hypothetical protein [Streptomyces ossamyceticus]
MSLHAQQFFTEHLMLPFAESAVVGDTYYAAPLPKSPLRLRIDFSRTIRESEYDGLRLAVVHPEKGDVDAVVLAFVEHGTFARRDAERDVQPGFSGYARILDLHHHNRQPPWNGAEVRGLRTAIEQYTKVWFPGGWTTSAHSRPAARTARNVPTAAAGYTAARAR